MARKYLLDKVRNIGIMAHIDAGKTTVTERMLFLTHKIRKIGETHDGESTMDWMDQEKERGITITSAATTATWNGYKINVIDTPGHVDFTVEVSRSLRVLDGAVTLLDAHTGVQSQTETVWRQANEFNVPRIIFANKMDIIGADFDETLKSIDDRFGVNAKAIQYPIGTADTFVGIIDLLSKKAYKFLNENEDMEEIEIPNDLIDIVNKKREELIESVVIFDDEVMEKYLDKEDISIDEIKLCIRKGVLKNEFFPVLCGTGLGNKGIKFLLDAIIDYLPSPIDVESTKAIDDNGNEFSIKVADDEPFRALAFKVMTDQFVGKLTFFRVYSGTLNKGQTVLNSSKDIKERVGRILLMNANDREDIETVYSGDIAAAVGLKNTTTGNTLCDMKHKCLLESMTFPEPVIELTVEPKSKEDQEKLMIALQKLAEEDPTFKVRSDLETGQTLIAGMGELHLEVIVDRLRREFNVECNIGMPKVSYRETITMPAECEGKYIKQSGGRGQYGHVKIKFEPNPSKGYEFINAIQGGVIPSEYISVIDKGLQEAMEGGMLAGYQVVDVKATLYDGSYHDVDSSEMAYKIAASFALRDAKEKCEPTLLEPIMKVDVEAPNEYLGNIIGDISSRRGKTLGTEMSGKFVKIHSLVPLKEMFGYVTSLRSNTQGRGTYTMLFDHYEQLPSSIVKEVTKQLNA